MTDRLNPEALDQHALEAAAKALDPQIGRLAERFPDSLSLEADMERLRTEARAAVSAYLAALPAPRTIKTVAELDALPVGTVVYAANQIGPSERFTVGWKGCGSAAAWSSAVLARDGLPACVLWVPTEGGGE